MCIVFFWKNDGVSNRNTPFSFIVASNRDEYQSRPSLPLHKWDMQGKPAIYAGKDEEAGGTWCGVAENGKFAVITNYRDVVQTDKSNLKSRGNLTLSYLSSDIGENDYAEILRETAKDYAGYNLLFGNIIKSDIRYVTNRYEHESELFKKNGLYPVNISREVSNGVEIVPHGLHALSNAILDSPWLKVERGKEIMAKIVHEIPDDATFENYKKQMADRLIQELLHDTVKETDPSRYPRQGWSRDFEGNLSPIFVSPFGLAEKVYGTRTCTILLVNSDCTEAAIYEYGLYNGTWASVEETVKFQYSPATANPQSAETKM